MFDALDAALETSAARIMSVAKDWHDDLEDHETRQLKVKDLLIEADGLSGRTLQGQNASALMCLVIQRQKNHRDDGDERPYSIHTQ